jgi:hypothetical protein
MWVLIFLIVTGPLAGLSSSVEFKSETACKAAKTKLGELPNSRIVCVPK